jgi:hypothetical protein
VAKKKTRDAKAKEGPKRKLVTRWEATNAESEWLKSTLAKKSTVGKVWLALKEHGPLTLDELAKRLSNVKTESKTTPRSA